MKKIFTLIACAFVALTSQAQILVTAEDGTPVENGGTVTFRAIEEEMGPGFAIPVCDPSGPSIKNTSGKDNTLTITVTREADSQLTWCFNMGCTPMTGITETRSTTLKDGKSVGLMLHANFGVTTGAYATYRAKVDCTLGSAKFSFNTVFVYDEQAGIHGTTQQSPITVQGKALRYSMGGEAAVINVFSADGRRVESERVSGEGTLSLSKLQSGVYVYEVLGQTGRKTSGKVFVR